MKNLTMKIEVRQAGRQGHRNAGSALGKYKLCVFGRSGATRLDEPFGEIYVPKSMDFPESITLNYKKGEGK
ncbi:MAG: hypothetical protein PHU49_08005 [Syntrophorhabdaceae bacterium]|nr:hypothetical protein [Syntrophorhabdaceae bacterium]MDD5243947.1 hypothetical protein [Syntrophorhabdaceae bacterium]